MTSAPTERSFWSRVAAVPARVWVALVLLALAAAFIVQNRAPVRIQWLFLSVIAPLWTALLAVTLIGFLAGLLVRRRSEKKRE